jgi:hypothetical protein
MARPTSKYMMTYTMVRVDFERGARRPLERTLRDIRIALEQTGVIFIDEDDEGPGVRLRKPAPTTTQR